MADDRWDVLCQRLAPEVRSFARAEFQLINDLRRLVDVHGIGATEAAIFYSARILEVLAAAALHAVNMPATSNLFGNLDLLERYNLIPAAARYGAHALRRQGNDVRHVGRVVTVADAELAIGFAQVVMHWFFCSLAAGHKLSAITKDRLPLGMSRDGELQHLLAALAHDDADVAALADKCLIAESTPLYQTPVIAAVLAERLLDHNELPRAWAILEQANRTFPDDLRLRQLTGLYLSRTGRLDEAIECLETLERAHGDDEETIGILAGAFKRRWQSDRSQIAWLRRAHQLYRTAWEKSKRSSSYLGINAATTVLWLGKPAEARRIASEVVALFDRRAAGVVGQGAAVTPGFWDQVSLAEAQLLLGQRKAAAKTYRQAFRTYSEDRAGIDLSRGQAAEILRATGCSAHDCEPFLAATAP